MTSQVLEPATSRREWSVLLVGNPNVGKTTLFNALTGLRHRVGNYPGVTVETKTGLARGPLVDLRITDVPGTYSLSPRSPDEMLAVDLLLGRRSLRNAPLASKSPAVASTTADLAANGATRPSAPTDGMPSNRSQTTPTAPSDRPDVVLAIVDACNLERNLYLVSQLLELGLPVVLAVNMVDAAEARGIRIDFEQLAQNLGVPVVPIQANKRRGLAELRMALEAAAGAEPPQHRPEFPAPFVEQVERLRQAYQEQQFEPPPAYLLERFLLDAQGYVEQALLAAVPAPFRSRLLAYRQEAHEALKAAGWAPLALEARTRYQWLATRVRPAIQQSESRQSGWSDWLDRLLLHRVWGVLIFLLVMFLLFQSIYFISDGIAWGYEQITGLEDGPIESTAVQLKFWLEQAMPPGALRSLLQDGIVSGVAGVLVFLPQIVLLFGFIAILEDCGYMARAAFLMDKVMAKCGLSGKSFIPLLTSFACAIPGVLATRTIGNRRDRLVTILVAPLMSCSARLPVYILLVSAFIPNRPLLGSWLALQGVVIFAMYLLGIITAPLIAWLLKQTILKSDTPVFIMELPSYKLPSPTMILYRMYDSGKAFVVRAGTIILLSSIVIWGLQYYPRSAVVAEQFEPQQNRLLQREAQLSAEGLSATAIESALAAERAALANQMAQAYQRQSFLGQMGRGLEPIFRPLGWDWRIGMAAIAAFPAREVIIAALGTIYSVGSEVDEQNEDLQQALRQATWDETAPPELRGQPVYTIPTALSLMVFFAFCCQCVSTLAVIRRETNSWSWPIFTFTYMTGLAYLAAFATYQIGSRL